MIKRITSAVAAIVLLAAILVPTVVQAQSTDSLSDSSVTQSIWAGLRRGVNIATGNTAPPQQTPPTNPTPLSSSGGYVALGDSVAAGLGLPPNGDAPARCGRSSEAYSNKVAAAQGLSLTSVACSGATAGDLVTSQGVSGPNIPPQLSQAFANGTPQLMTLTAGANDIHWATFLNKCLASTCGTSSDTSIANTYLAALHVKLAYAFTRIQSRSNGQPPTVVLTGYYNPTASCAGVDSRFSAAEAAWFNSQVAALNQSLQQVSSRYNFVRFAPVDFTGHDICSADPWVQGLQDPAPIHPTAAGQNAIAEAVLSKL